MRRGNPWCLCASVANHNEHLPKFAQIYSSFGTRAGSRSKVNYMENPYVTISYHGPTISYTNYTKYYRAIFEKKTRFDHNGNLLKFTQATFKWEVEVRQVEVWSNQRLISLGMYRNCVHRIF